MKELSLDKLENLEGGKFWGKSCGEGTPFSNGCIRDCKYQVFWITVDRYSETGAC